MSKWIVSGATGQDGSNLIELLLSKGEEVIGLIRRNACPNSERYGLLLNLEENKGLTLEYFDLADSSNINNLINKYKPDYFVNTAAMSVSGESRVPIKMYGEIKHPEFKELWKKYAKNSKIRVEKIDGLDVEVIDLPHNKDTYALGYWNGQGTWFPIKQLSRHKFKGKIARMTQKFGRIEVTPNHSIYDVNQKLCTPEENPMLLNIRKMNYYNCGKNKDSLKTTLFGKLKGDKLEAYLRFIGAFIAEGSTCYNKANRGYVCAISNNDKEWLQTLEKDIKLISDFKTHYTLHKPQNSKEQINYELVINNRKLFNFLRKECGTKSGNKKIPFKILKLNSNLIRTLTESMIRGDGSINKYGLWSYATSSYELACQMSMITTMLGYDYTIDINDHKDKENWNTVYNIRQCLSYKVNDNNDKKDLEWIEYDDYVYDIEVDEVHNFAIGLGNIVVHNSHVAISFNTPESTINYNLLGVLRILEAIKNFSPKTKFLQCSSSEQFGITPPPQNEDSKMLPQSPYGIAKLGAYHLVRLYRNSYGLFACNSICFNHEGPRRTINFVTRKITTGISRIITGKQKKLILGNLSSCRDWGESRDYVKAMYLIITHNKPDDFVVATNETHSIKEFVKDAFELVGLNWEEYVESSDRYKRPAEVPALLGNPKKITEILNWKPEYNYKMIIKEMLEHDLKENGINSIEEAKEIVSKWKK